MQADSAVGTEEDGAEADFTTQQDEPGPRAEMGACQVEGTVRAEACLSEYVQSSGQRQVQEVGQSQGSRRRDEAASGKGGC